MSKQKPAGKASYSSKMAKLTPAAAARVMAKADRIMGKC